MPNAIAEYVYTQLNVPGAGFADISNRTFVRNVLPMCTCAACGCGGSGTDVLKCLEGKFGGPAAESKNIDFVGSDGVTHRAKSM